jgi:deaminated glutathione amidase
LQRAKGIEPLLARLQAKRLLQQREKTYRNAFLVLLFIKCIALASVSCISPVIIQALNLGSKQNCLDLSKCCIFYTVGGKQAAHQVQRNKKVILKGFKVTPTKIAVHQMCSGVDTRQNCAAMADAISLSAARGAVIYFAPEMSCLLDRNRDRARPNITAESKSAELRTICALAKSACIWVHLGSMAVVHETSGKFANRSLVISPDGVVRARYDKMHLFDVDLSTGESWRESSAYAGGDSPVAVATPLGLMGLTICYDVRFPSLFAALIGEGVDVIAVPAAFTVPTGKAHWHALLTARAIEAEAFVIAAAQSGEHEDGRRTFGHSLVIDPWGETLLDMGEGEGLGFAELDLSRLAEVRAQIPVHANRRDIDMPVRRF